jgi:hypothetical protein
VGDGIALTGAAVGWMVQEETKMNK